MNMTHERVHENLRHLKLGTVSEVLDNRLNAAQTKDKSFLEVLGELLEEEVQTGRANSIETRTRLGGLPTRRTLDDFDYELREKLAVGHVTLHARPDRHGLHALATPGVDHATTALLVTCSKKRAATSAPSGSP